MWYGAIDQGTTSTRFIIYDLVKRKQIALARRPVRTVSKHPGWAEQDPIDILRSVCECIDEVSQHLGSPLRHLLQCIN